MRSKLIFLAPFAFVGCYKAGTAPEICTPVVTSWGSPVYHCASSPMATLASGPLTLAIALRTPFPP